MTRLRASVALRLPSVLALSALAAALSGCSAATAGVDARQSQYTGEVQVYGVDHTSGRIIDRDVWPAGSEQSPTVTVAKGDVVTVTLNTLFLRHIAETKGGVSHLLVYGEVYDDGTDDPATSFTKIVHDFQGQAEGTRLSFADRPIYGPTHYSGFPLRIKLYAIELDRSERNLASRIIDAGGRVAAQFAPQAAPFIGIAIEIAQMVNALNKDDFELRCDLTLHPTGPAGVYDVDQPKVPVEPQFVGEIDKRKIRVVRENDVPLYEYVPANDSSRHRQGETLTLNTAFRTGKYFVVKRETDRRGNAVGNNTIEFDWTQAVQSNDYTSPDGKIGYRTDELFRLQGDVMYRIVQRIEREYPGSKPDWIEEDLASVGLGEGPNAGFNFTLVPGLRQQIRDQSYAVLSIRVGGDVALTPEQMRAASERDAAQLEKLLTVPPGTDTSEEMADRVDGIATAVISAIEQREITRQIGKQVGADPSLRAKPDYVILWTKQVRAVPKEDDGESARRAVIARNHAALDVLRGLVVNLPYVRADDPETANFQLLTADDFEAVAPPADPTAPPPPPGEEPPADDDDDAEPGDDEAAAAVAVAAAADDPATKPAKKKQKRRGVGTFRIKDTGLTKLATPVGEDGAKPADGGAARPQQPAQPEQPATRPGAGGDAGGAGDPGTGGDTGAGGGTPPADDPDADAGRPADGAGGDDESK